MKLIMVLIIMAIITEISSFKTKDRLVHFLIPMFFTFLAFITDFGMMNNIVNYSLILLWMLPVIADNFFYELFDRIIIIKGRKSFVFLLLLILVTCLFVLSQFGGYEYILYGVFLVGWLLLAKKHLLQTE